LYGTERCTYPSAVHQDFGGETPNYPQNPSSEATAPPVMGLGEASQIQWSEGPLPEAPHIKHVSLPPVENESPFLIASP